jgi:1-acyl-sn-glycerol-3-phosphate acyltransferase
MTTRPIESTDTRSRLDRAGRALRGVLFFFLWIAFLLLVTAPVQRLLLWPLVTLLPSRRTRIMGPWLRFQGNAVLVLCRVTAGVRIDVSGEFPKEAVVALMNHQSVFDIPMVLAFFRGPPPLIPTRERYKRYIPALSQVLRLARYPFVSQLASGRRNDLAAIQDACARVARGENSLVIFAEGHRSRDGRIGRFMRGGPRIILTQTRRPVYTIVADGMVGARTFTDALAILANRRIRVRIDGPYEPPTEAEADAFLDRLHADMSATLEALRRQSPP